MVLDVARNAKIMIVAADNDGTLMDRALKATGPPRPVREIVKAHPDIRAVCSIDTREVRQVLPVLLAAADLATAVGWGYAEEGMFRWGCRFRLRK